MEWGSRQGDALLKKSIRFIYFVKVLYGDADLAVNSLDIKEDMQGGKI